MTQDEKESFIRFNTLLGEIKDIDASMEQVKVNNYDSDDRLEANSTYG